jgi:glutamyl-tRNA synthetase
MHLGNARTALLAWLACRAAGGTLVLRLEDLDNARAERTWVQSLLADLHWLGLDWDEGPDVGGPHAPYVQSERRARYDAVIDQLLSSDHAFLCACSRADVARAASAPHGEEPGAGPRYPGTCRALAPDEVRARAAAAGRPPTVRFRADSARALPFTDLVHGAVDPLPLPAGVDDFVIRRADGVAAYQLAVVVDDAAMGITQVVRGDDLLSSTPRQLALYHALALPPPGFAHVPLVLSPGGERLAKRTRPVSLAELRERGVSPASINGALAASAGLCPAGTALRARDLLPGLDLARLLAGLPRAPVVIDAANLEGAP